MLHTCKGLLLEFHSPMGIPRTTGIQMPSWEVQMCPGEVQIGPCGRPIDTMNITSPNVCMSMGTFSLSLKSIFFHWEVHIGEYMLPNGDSQFGSIYSFMGSPHWRVYIPHCGVSFGQYIRPHGDFPLRSIYFPFHDAKKPKPQSRVWILLFSHYFRKCRSSSRP
jgi:hypothetical protein